MPQHRDPRESRQSAGMLGHFRTMTVLAFAATPFLILTACGSPQKPAAQPSKSPGITVVVGGDLDGYISPCGCTKPMIGGITRRATLVRSLESAGPLVKIENGDLTEAAGRQDQLKAETLVDMFAAMHYDAINIGEEDLLLGLPYLQSLEQRAPGMLVSANVCDHAGKAITRAFVTLTRNVGPQPVRIAVVGVLSAQYGELVSGLDSTIEVRPPEESLQKLMPEVSAQSDVRILMVHGSRAEAERLAQQFPSFQAVVYAHEDDPPAEGAAPAGPSLICAGKKGRRLGIATLSGAAGWPVTSVEYRKVGPEFADDKSIAVIERSYLARVGSENLLAQVARLPSTGKYVGTQACEACHAPAHDVWKATPHSRAYQTLKTQGHDLDPECVSCHVVGGDKMGGFKTLTTTPHLVDVGCESCHGPAAAHAAQPAAHTMAKIGENACRQCHVSEHSPGFDFKVYWKQIAH
jgi:hypothetical protein